METRSLGQALHYLRQIVAPAHNSRLDAELLERFVTIHDGAAFARLVERHGPLVLGVCRRVLHNQHDAEDAFQATFLVLARKARQIRQRDALASWLYRVAYHLAVKLRSSTERRRRSKRQPPPVREKPPEDQITWGDMRRVLDEEMDRLPEKYRAPLLLCCLAGRTRDEAAGQLGWSIGALKMRLERGRQLLRTRLARRGLTVSAAMLAMVLAQHATASSVPAVLATTTVKAGLRLRDLTVYREALDQGWLRMAGGQARWAPMPDDARALLAGGLGRNNYVDMHPYRLSLLAAQAQNFSGRELARATAHALAAHRQMVSSSVPQPLVLELLLIRILARPQRTRPSAAVRA